MGHDRCVASLGMGNEAYNVQDYLAMSHPFLLLLPSHEGRIENIGDVQGCWSCAWRTREAQSCRWISGLLEGALGIPLESRPS